MTGFEFYNPVRVLFGPGEVKRVGEEAAKLGSRALLVSYPQRSSVSGVRARIVDLLEAAGVAVVPYFAVTANPTLAQVNSGIEMCGREKVDLVIGVGGGSPMDAAKFIAAGVFYGDSVWEMTNYRLSIGSSKPPGKSLPTLMVPTLPATSSEVNNIAVITNEETKEKSNVIAECMYPKTSILDPELTLSLPAFQTACGGADAISHAMEMFLNSVDECPLQNRMQAACITTLMEYIPAAITDPADVNARTIIMWSSAVAWNGWTRPGTSCGAPMHQLGHVLSARYNVTHGATLSIVMPAWMKYCRTRDVDRYALLAERVFGLGGGEAGKEECAGEAVSRFEAFLKSLGIPTGLKDVGVPASDIPLLAEDVDRVSSRADGTLNSRVRIVKDDVRKIFEMAV